MQNELYIKITSIEHIMSDFVDYDYTSYFANLLPFSTKANSKLGNKPFVKKLKKYKQSNILTIKRFIENYGTLDECTEQNIRNRTKKIAEYVINKI